MLVILNAMAAPRPAEEIALHIRVSHSPELNPVEHIWEDLREKAMPNKEFESLDLLEDALCHRLKELESHPETIRSMTNFPYLRITC
ncbi:MAG: hypothetical protein ACLQPD_36950 [Desulfomonilaceae bacterium]